MVLARYNAVPNIKSKGCFNMKPLVVFTSEEVLLASWFKRIMPVKLKAKSPKPSVSLQR